MLRLYILRHAKSSWAMPGKTDFDRPLNERGKKDLPKIAAYMEKHDYCPDVIYSSSSQRTRQTIRGITSHLTKCKPQTHFVDELYSGSFENYLRPLINHQTSAHALMIVGHNPTSDSLAAALINDGETKAIKTIAYKFPTGALAVIDLKLDNWSQIAENTGYLQDFMLPREL